jgi:hypothetical protein
MICDRDVSFSAEAEFNPGTTASAAFRSQGNTDLVRSLASA